LRRTPACTPQRNVDPVKVLAEINHTFQGIGEREGIIEGVERELCHRTVRPKSFDDEGVADRVGGSNTLPQAICMSETTACGGGIKETRKSRLSLLAKLRSLLTRPQLLHRARSKFFPRATHFNSWRQIRRTAPQDASWLFCPKLFIFALTDDLTGRA
jgi:hypothetical protein